LRIDDAGLAVAGRRDDRLHDQAGAEDEPVQTVQIGVEILDRAGATPVSIAARATAGAIRRISRWSNGRRDQVVRAEGLGLAAIGACGDIGRLLAGKLGDRLDGGELHFLVDRGRAGIERAAEDIGEAQDVVDLVGIVGAAGAHHHVVAHGKRVSGMISGFGLASARISGFSAIRRPCPASARRRPTGRGTRRRRG
jgi:hypothetical protein